MKTKNDVAEEFPAELASLFIIRASVKTSVCFFLSSLE